MSEQNPRLSAYGEGITQDVLREGQWVRLVLVAPDENGAPGVLTRDGVAQAARWRRAIDGLVRLWVRRVESGEQSQSIAARAQRQADAVRLMLEELAVETAEELAKLPGARIQAAFDRAYERVSTGVRDFFEVIGDGLGTAGTLVKVAAGGVLLIGAAKFINAARGR